MITIDSHIQGIPCKIQAEREYHPPARKPLALCDDPDEAFGIDEIEYIVLDRKGYRAGWLECKITEADDDRIRDEVVRAYDDLETEARLTAAGL